MFKLSSDRSTLLSLMAKNQRISSSFAFFLILLLARVWRFDVLSVTAQPFVADGTVIELKDSDFESAISTFDFILVDFYAPWCGHCKRLSPLLDEAAPILAQLKQPIVIAKLDADKYRKLASKHEIDGYPTLKLFVHGVPIDYKGPRKADQLIQFLKKYVAPDVSVLESVSAVHSFVEEAGKHFPIFIGFGLDESLLSEYGKKYKKKAWFAVAQGFSEELMVAYDFDKTPALVVIHPSYYEHNVFYGPFDGDFLDEFVRQNQLPLIVPVNYETLKMLNSDDRKVVLTIVNDEMDGKSVELFKILRSAAAANRDLVFGYVGVKQWEDFTDTFDVNRNTKLPKILVWDGNDDYQLVEGSESLDNLEDQGSQINLFLKGYRDGRTIRKEVTVPSFMDFIKTLFGIKTVYLIVFAAAFVIFMRKFVKRGDDVLHKRQAKTESEELNQQDYQPGDKEE